MTLQYRDYQIQTLENGMHRLLDALGNAIYDFHTAYSARVHVDRLYGDAHLIRGL